MLKKIALIALLTGSGQIFAILVLKLLSKHVAPEQLKAIGQIDSLVFFMTNFIALGLQSVAIRNLALANNWQKEYYSTQQARITLGLFLACLGVLFIVNKYYLLFLLAPVLAMSGDYALYGRGFPVFGSFIAFTRTFIPFLILVLLFFFQPGSLSWGYALGLSLVYMVTNFLISKYLDAPYYFHPQVSSLRLYVSSIGIGLVTLSLYFIGQGLVLIIPYFYSALVTSVAFVGLKLYMIYKGLLRILHQAFVKEMTNEDVCFKVDQLSILAGLMFVGSVALFPKSFITLLFGQKYITERSFFLLLAAGGLIYSLFLSMSTRSMLQRKDKAYARITVMAALLAILFLIVSSFWGQTSAYVALSICVGEIYWSLGLLKITGTKSAVTGRLAFLFQNLPFFVFPLIVRWWFGDRLEYYILGFSVVGVVLLVLHWQKFTRPLNP
jgi:O-antigen/teichoic acid export membrane protein